MFSHEKVSGGSCILKREIQPHTNTWFFTSKWIYFWIYGYVL